MSVSRLLIDVGNTRLKWWLTHTEQVSLSGSVRYQDEPDAWQRFTLPAGSKPQQVLVGSVAASEQNEQLRSWCTSNALPAPEFAAVKKSHLGLTVAYDTVSKLGVDRWLAMLGGRRLVDGAVCVADIGTALTLDCVAPDGRHLGGLIAPGPGLMIAALLRDTAQIREATDTPVNTPFATDTGDSVRSGAVYACAALVDRFAAEAKARLNSPITLLLTGGGRDVIKNLLDTEVHEVPDLVPQGLLALALAADDK